MHALSVSLLRAKQLPVITNGLGASPHAGSTCTIGVVTVRPLNRLPARLYFKLKPDPNNTFFFIFTCTTQYPWVLANLSLSQAMAPSKKKRTHTVFRDSSAHRSASTSKPRFVGERVKLGDVLQVVNGKNQKAVKDENGQYPIYGSGGQMGWASSCICPADTVIIGRKGNINKPIYVSEPFWNVDTAFGLVAKPELLDARYLYHFCKHYDFGKLNTTCTIPSLTRKNIEGILLRLPSLGGQKETAAQLDSILKQIALAQQEIAGLDSLVKSRFVEMFGELDTNPKGFQLTCFDDLGTWTSGGTPSRKNPSYFTGEIDWYSAGELNSLHLGRSKERISLRAIEESSAKLVPPGSLFVGMYDTAALKMGITTKESSSNQACANLVPNGIVDLVWLYFAIDQLKPSLLAKRSGCRQKNLSLKKIKSFMVPLPDLDSQQGFSRFVAQVDKSRFVRDHEMNFR